MAALFLGGFFYIAGPQLKFAWQRHAGTAANQGFWKNQRLSDAALTPDIGQPEALRLPRLGIDLNIKNGAYNNATHAWTLNRSDVFYVAPGTYPLSKSSQPLIYGHDIKGVFLNLDGIASSEPLIITNRQGQSFLYKYRGDRVVEPDEVAGINMSPPARGVSLLTCTGPTFSKRRIFYFEYVSSVNVLRPENGTNS